MPENNEDRSDVDRVHFCEAVRRALRESELGLGRPAEDVYAGMKLKYGLQDVPDCGAQDDR